MASSTIWFHYCNVVALTLHRVRDLREPFRPAPCTYPQPAGYFSALGSERKPEAQRLTRFGHAQRDRTRSYYVVA
jgi:hypothetical protein